MTTAAPRRNVKGEGIMRAYRIGRRSGSRFFACASSRSTGQADQMPAPTTRGCPRGSSDVPRARARVAACKSGVNVTSWKDVPPRQEVLRLTRRLGLDLRSLFLLLDDESLRTRKQSSARSHEPPPSKDPRPSERSGSCSGPLLEKVERTARTTPKPPKTPPTATSGQATRRGKRAPSNDIPSRVPLAAAASACSWVLRGAPPF